MVTATLHRLGRRPPADRRELRQRLRPDRPGRRDADRVHQRGRQGLALPEQAWPETDGPRINAIARRDPESQTVSLILDATTASTANFAITAHADEREAHVREVEQFGQSLPEGSYGRRNRQAPLARCG